jgi:hypothetical protein
VGRYLQSTPEELDAQLFRGSCQEGNDAYAELLGHVMYAGGADDPVHHDLRIQKFHRNKISQFVVGGLNKAEYVWMLRKKSVARIIVPSNRLLYALDPKGTRKLDRVINDIRQYQRKYICFLN